MNLLFPFDIQRKYQSEIISDIYKALSSGKSILLHAPTGIGKTAASISPALTYALENNKFIIFVTPRHTQHRIAVETFKHIKEKYNLDINGVDFIGKRNMCLIPGIDTLSSRDFTEFCSEVKKNKGCDFYNNIYNENELTNKASEWINHFSKKGPFHVEELIKVCQNANICPYEISCDLAKKSSFIIADYYHIFHPHIRKIFLSKIKKDLKDAIIIVDEAQNLPSRIRDILSSKLSTRTLEIAYKEAERFDYKEEAEDLLKITEVIMDLQKLEGENYLAKEVLIKEIEKAVKKYYESLMVEFEFIGNEIREKNKRSFVGAVATFLKDWINVENIYYTRIIKKQNKKGKLISEICLTCLDPSTSSKELFNEVYSSILMSGTLTPIRMYRDILGLNPEKSICKEYESPFNISNRLALIIPETTTRYVRRTEEEFRKIAKWCARISNTIKGNVAIFFPSYKLRDEIGKYFERNSLKSIFIESPDMSKVEKAEFLAEFKKYADIGAVVLGVISGSFGEGIDLPGKFLRGVIVVGIPLDVPDLETKALISYYDKKFNLGNDYGYIFPAMNRVVQACGRVIRSEKDYGVVALIDERFTWEKYHKCLPPDWKFIVTMTPEERIKKFFVERT